MAVSCVPAIFSTATFSSTAGTSLKTTCTSWPEESGTMYTKCPKAGVVKTNANSNAKCSLITLAPDVKDGELKLANGFAAAARGDGLPSRQIDLLTDESRAAVGEENIDAAR